MEVIQGPWAEPLESSAGFPVAEVHRAWAEYFERVGVGEQRVTAQDAQAMVEYFRREADHAESVLKRIEEVSWHPDGPPSSTRGGSP